MAGGLVGTAVRDVGRLFSQGSGAGLAEGQLLERFVDRGDDSALGALVERHGPMVLGICRGFLPDPNDVDDAFQATFLVLVRKAGALRRHDQLASWIYGVALRVARRARIDAHKRRAREAESSLEPPTLDSVALETEAADLRRALHDEIARLPFNYRQVVVLCHLEGRSHEEAAKLLNQPIGTVKGRLSRARDLLRDRLARRGITAASASVGIGALSTSTAEAAVPASLVAGTLSLAIGQTARSTAGVAAGAVASSGALRLMEGAIESMSISQLKIATAGFLALAVCGSGTGYAVLAAQAKSEAKATAGSPAKGQGTSSSAATSAGIGKSTAGGSSTASSGGASAGIGQGSAGAAVKSTAGAAGGIAPGPLGELGLEATPANLLMLAKRNYEAADNQYKAGKITIDRVVEASKLLAGAQLAVANNPADEARARNEAVARLAGVVKSERELFKQGRTTSASVASAEVALLQAALDAAQPTPQPGGMGGGMMMGSMPGMGGGMMMGGMAPGGIPLPGAASPGGMPGAAGDMTTTLKPPPSGGMMGGREAGIGSGGIIGGREAGSTPVLEDRDRLVLDAEAAYQTQLKNFNVTRAIRAARAAFDAQSIGRAATDARQARTAFDQRLKALESEADSRLKAGRMTKSMHEDALLELLEARVQLARELANEPPGGGRGAGIAPADPSFNPTQDFPMPGGFGPVPDTKVGKAGAEDDAARLRGALAFLGSQPDPTLPPDAPRIGFAERLRAKKPVPEDEALSDALRKKLDKVVDLEFKDASLKQVLETLAAQHEFPFFLDPVSLADAGQSPDSAVVFRLGGVPLRTSLNLLLSQYGLEYQLIDGVLVVGARDWARAKNRKPTPEEEALNESIRKKLDKPIDLDFKNLPLRDVVEFVSSTRAVPIFIDTNSLNDAGHSPDSPVDFQLAKVPLRTGLRLLLKQYELDYEIADGVLKIGADAR